MSLNIPGISAQVPLDRLATTTALTEEQKVAEATRLFEAVLLRQILRDAYKPVIRSALNQDSFAADVYRDLTVAHLAEAISRQGGVGLARELATQLRRQAPAAEHAHE
ncbi:MAG: rod-binding protein [Verrucomicrobiae bacterium]|nr:rod-binding protein [Verrucomicrobiae bacterium]